MSFFFPSPINLSFPVTGYDNVPVNYVSKTFFRETTFSRSSNYSSKIQSWYQPSTDMFSEKDAP